GESEPSDDGASATARRRMARRDVEERMRHCKREYRRGAPADHIVLPRPARDMQGLSGRRRDERRAGRRQVRKPQRLAGRRWRRMKRFFGEPPIELPAAAVARRRRRLVMALRIAARTGEPDMEMVIVAPPRPDIRHPRP